MVHYLATWPPNRAAGSRHLLHDGTNFPSPPSMDSVEIAKEQKSTDPSTPTYTLL